MHISSMIRSRINSNQDERVIIDYDDTTRAWNDWKHGNIIQQSSVPERYVVSLVECTKTYMIHNHSMETFHRSISSDSFDIPSLVHTKPEVNLNCHLCRKYQGRLYSCRVCGKVYHQQCIKDSGEMKSYHLIKNATDLIGWTCPTCEDLRIFLSVEELAETNVSNDFNIHVVLPIIQSAMDQFLRTFLNTIADMTSNRLSQIDLLLLDVIRKILRTPPKCLVHALSPMELYRLSQLFLSLSSPDNSCITREKFHQIFSTYLLTTMPELHSDNKQLHLEALAYCMLGDGIKSDRTWNQFVLDATIPVLLGRYNHRTPVDFINRIVSSKRSTSPSSTRPNRHEDGQSLAMFINNVLQKLTQTSGYESKREQPRVKHTTMQKRTNEVFKR